MAGAEAHQRVAVDLPQFAPSEVLPRYEHGTQTMKRYWISTDEAAKLYAELGVALGLI